MTPREGIQVSRFSIFHHISNILQILESSSISTFDKLEQRCREKGMDAEFSEKLGQLYVRRTAELWCSLCRLEQMDGHAWRENRRWTEHFRRKGLAVVGFDRRKLRRFVD